MIGATKHAAVLGLGPFKHCNMFRVFIETYNKPSITNCNEFIGRYKLLRKIWCPTPDWTLQISDAKDRNLVSKSGVRTPWPLVTNRVLPRDLGPWQENNEKLALWMQEQVAVPVAQALVAYDSNAIDAQDSVMMILERAMAAARGHDNSMSTMITALEQLRLGGMNSSIDATREAIAASEQMLTCEQAKFAEVNEERLSMQQSVANQKKDVEALKALWNDYYGQRNNTFEQLTTNNPELEILRSQVTRRREELETHTA